MSARSLTAAARDRDPREAAPRPAERVTFVAADGTRLSALVDRPPRGGASSAVLVLPGFWRRAESPRIRWLAQQLAGRFPTYSLDFRGHGRSSGSFTFGRLEHLDVLALMAFARSQGIERVALVGTSMGAASIATTLGGGDALPVDVAAAVLVSGPADLRAVRPRPWRGRRDVAWTDALHPPRVEWRVPFTEKRTATSGYERWPDVPVRFLHARADWLVDEGAAQQMHGSRPQRGDFYLLDLDMAGLHADELLGRFAEPVLRLVRPFVESSLAGEAPSVEDAGVDVDPAPWLAGLRACLEDPAACSRDLGGVPPCGEVEQVVAISAGRDGIHLVARVGGETCIARGLRDGSVHGVNLLANALAADASAWPRRVRVALDGAHARIAGSTPPGAGSRHVVVPRGDGGFEVRPSSTFPVRPART